MSISLSLLLLVSMYTNCHQFEWLEINVEAAFIGAKVSLVLALALQSIYQAN